MKQVYLWETKTSSENIAFGSTFWKRTTLDPQLSLYIPALREMGYDPLGAVYDVLRKPAQKPSSKGETPERYRDRCLEAIAEKPDYYYARGKVVRLEADEREAAVDVWQTAGQMRDSRRLNIYPRNPGSCMDWNRECEYLGVCAGMASIDDPLLFLSEKANVELDGAEDLSLLTQSGMGSYRKCQRKYFYRYVVRRRPNVKAQTLATGSSIHKALDVFRQTGGDLDLAKKALITEDLFIRAKEEAMLIGYVARWDKPVGIIAVEKQFHIPLVNPETGAASRTWSLGGRVDAIIDAESVTEMLNPSLSASPPQMDLEEQLRASVEANSDG